MYICVYSSRVFRPVVRLADICIPAQTSSPQTNVPVRRTFLVLYRHPNRPQGQQEVGLSVHIEYMLVYVFYTEQAAVFIIFDLFLLCSRSRGVWTWRKPTFYWGAEPYVSLHHHHLCLPLEITEPFLTWNMWWNIYFLSSRCFCLTSTSGLLMLGRKKKDTLLVWFTRGMCLV